MLGVIFDRQLSWTPYLKYLKTNTTNAINIMKILSHTSWGGSTNALIKIHKSLIQSKMNYGAILYKTASNSKLNWIDSVNNNGIRLAMGAFRSSPISSIYNLAGEPIPEIKRIELHLKYTVRCAKSNITIYEKNNKDLIKLIKENKIKLPHIITNEINTKPPWTRNYLINTELSSLSKQQTPHIIYRNHLKSIIENYQDNQEVYTDGSKTHEGVGLSIIFPPKKILYKLSPSCSIFTAEAMAILKAVEIIIQEEHSKFIILSDSLSTIKNIQNQFNPGDIATKIQNKLNKAYEHGKKITIIWIPGHAGIRGNEIADEQASLAIKNTDTPPIKQISYDDTKKYIKKCINDKWQNIWTKQNTKLSEIKGDTTKWHNPLLKRKEEVVINRLRIGHTRITHGFLMAKEDPPICTTCGTNLTVKHIISNCIKYNQERIKHGIPHNLDAALGPNLLLNTDLIKFLKQTNIYNQI